ncbi:MAG: SRPBCC domain-containing protein [Verrucomicrobiota bacterium]
MSDSTTINEADGLSLEITRRFNAPRQAVFDAWSTYDAIAQWMGPGHCNVFAGEVDFRVGGTYRFEMTTDTIGNVAVGGTYREISPPEKLAFSWKWEQHEEISNAEMEIVLEFIDLGNDETEMRLTQTGFPEREVAENHGEGWNGSFDKLAPYLAGT